jgi:hypothetical protein
VSSGVLLEGLRGGDVTNKEKIKIALDFAYSYGQADGAHHKAWAIDQIVRILTGCPTVKKRFLAYDGKPYTDYVLGESEEYKKFVREKKAGEDGPETYEWDEGIAP